MNLSTCQQVRQLQLTWVAFAEHLDGCGHFLLTDAFVLLPLGGSLEALPGQRTQVEIHEDISQRLQVIPSGLLCNDTGRLSSLQDTTNESFTAQVLLLPMPRCVFMEA